MRLLRHTFTLLLFSCVSLLAQPEKKSEIEIRMVAERLPARLGKVALVSGEDRSEPFQLPMNNLSEPRLVSSRVFQLVSVEQNVSVAKVALPAQGKSFVLLLIPTADKGYSPIVLPYNTPNFKAGDIYLYNNAKDTVVGMVGDGKFSVDPGKGTFFRPVIKDDNKRYHDVGIGVKFESGDRVISTTRWPKSNNTRYYVFFYVNPRTNRVAYRAVDEFLEPEPVAN